MIARRVRRRVVAPMMAMAIAACGRVTEGDRASQNLADSGASPATADATTAPHVPPFEGGAFELHITGVTVAGGVAGPANDSPSLRTSFHVDIARRDGKLVGSVMPRFGRVFEVEAREADDVITLVGAVETEEPGTPLGILILDQWTELALGRAVDGALDGTVRASGSKGRQDGDATGLIAMRGTGAIEPDETAPVAKVVAASSLGPLDTILPWDPIRLELAEPLPMSAVRASLSMVANGSIELLPDEPLTWESSWAGMARVRAYAKRWSGAIGAGVVRFAPTADAVGLVSAPVERAVTFAPLGAEVSSIGFDTDVIAGHRWGGAELLGGGVAGASDPRCETIGCMRLTLAAPIACRPRVGGIAARLNRGPKGKVQVRYRLLVDPEAPTYFDWSDGGFAVQLASEGGARTWNEIGSGAAKAFTAPVDGYLYGTDWSTLSIDVPTGTGPLGFALSSFVLAPCAWYTEKRTTQTVVLIESVVSE